MKHSGNEEQTHQRRAPDMERLEVERLEGNIYKGWAIGLHDSMRGGLRVLLLTGLVMAVQVLAPIVMFIWLVSSVPHMGRPVYVWQQELDCAAMFTKVLGGCLLLLVYLTGDMHLERLDRQTVVLETVFQDVSATWMFIDAVCNCGCVAGSACVLPLLMWQSDKTPVTILLDVFGLMFLTNLDDYASIINFGTDDCDFKKVVQDAVAETRPLILEPGGSVRSDSLGSEHLVRRLRRGHFMFSMTRLLNLIIGCLAVPAFCFTKFVASWPNSNPSDVRDVLSNPVIVTLAMVFFIAAHVPPAMYFFGNDFLGERDAFGFAYVVLLRRDDPRIEVDWGNMRL